MKRKKQFQEPQKPNSHLYSLRSYSTFQLVSRKLTYISKPKLLVSKQGKCRQNLLVVSKLHQARCHPQFRCSDKGSKQDEAKSAGDSLAQIGKSGAVLMVCRTCGKKGDHWTSKCLFKDLAQPSETFVDRPPSREAPDAGAGSQKSDYVPPSMRGGAAERRSGGGTEMRRRNEEKSVRVTKLSEDTREADLMELFCPFGHVSRVYIAIDEKTGTSRGFGFVNFINREDAERAINKLNGYGYDNLILRVEWVAPKAT